MIEYQPLMDRWTGGDLDRWASVLQEQLGRGLSHQRYGDLRRWLDALEKLPDITPDNIQLNDTRVGASLE